MEPHLTDRRRPPRRILFSGAYILRWGVVLLLGGTLASGCMPSRPPRADTPAAVAHPARTQLPRV